jgi:uncharacterized membrane protein
MVNLRLKFKSRRFIIAIFCMFMLAAQLWTPKSLAPIVNVFLVLYLVLYAGYTTVEKIVTLVKHIDMSSAYISQPHIDHGSQ